MSSLLESNAVDDSDEYDFDEFSAADLDAIPALSAPASTQVEQVEQPVQPQQQDTISPEHTNDLKDTTAPENTNTTATSSNTVVGHRGGLDETREPSPSSEYPDEFEYDNDFFAIVDNAESTVLCGKQSEVGCDASGTQTLRPTTPTNLTATTSKQPETSSTQGLSHDEQQGSTQTMSPSRSLVRKRSRDSDVSNERHSPARADVPVPQNVSRGDEQQSEKKLRKLMDSFEDEMTCPICYDLYACAYLFNPCGHSYCGECGLDWVEKNKTLPVCAVCRGPVQKRLPMIANIALDSAVQRHVDALRENGVEGWRDDGVKWKDWCERKELWKTVGILRLTGKKKGRKKKSREPIDPSPSPAVT